MIIKKVIWFTLYVSIYISHFHMQNFKFGRQLTNLRKKIFKIWQKIREKSRIQETTTLSAYADSSTDTMKSSLSETFLFLWALFRTFFFFYFSHFLWLFWYFCALFVEGLLRKMFKSKQFFFMMSSLITTPF